MSSAIKYKVANAVNVVNANVGEVRRIFRVAFGQPKQWMIWEIDNKVRGSEMDKQEVVHIVLDQNAKLNDAGLAASLLAVLSGVLAVALVIAIIF